MTPNRSIKRTLLYEEVVNRLYEIIDDGNLKPGDKLPTERELTAQLGISRNVLREAFHVLEKRGIISSRQGQGRSLRHIPGSETGEMKFETLSENLELVSMKDAYEVRQVLEIKAVELIIRNYTDEKGRLLEESYNELKRRFDETGSTAGEFEMHKLYARLSGSFFLEEVLNLVIDTTLEMMHSKMINVLALHIPDEELESHRKIIDAIKVRDTERAKMLMFDHLQGTMDMLK